MVEVLVICGVLSLEISFVPKACLLLMILLTEFKRHLMERAVLMAIIYVLWLFSGSGQGEAVWGKPSQDALTAPIQGYCYNVQKNSCDVHILRNDQWEKIRVYVFEMPKEFEGQAVAIGNWKPYVFETTNQDGFDQEEFLVAKGYRAAIKARSMDFSVVSLGPDPDLLRRLAYVFKSQLIERGKDLTLDTAMLYNALLLGVLPDDEAFKVTLQSLGLLHLFVVSGFHFSVVMAVVSLLSGRLTKKRYIWHQIVVLVASTAYYLATCGGFGSWRSLMAIILGILGFYTKRRVSGHIGLTLLMLCAGFVRPAVLSQFGFIVTFLASAIVIATGQKLATITIKGEPLPQMVILFIQSLCVYLAVLPFVLDAYGSSNVLQIALTVLATPLVVAFVWLSAIWVLIWPLPLVSPYFALVVEICSKFIFEMLATLQSFGVMTVAVSYRWVLLAQVAIWVIAALWGMPRFRMAFNLRRLIAMGLMLVMLVNGVLLIDRVDWGLSIRSFALRDGDAFLIRGPDLVMLYDVGNDPQLLQLLDKAGVDEIDYVIVSHPHQDHIGMLAQIAQRFQIGQIITTCESESAFSKGAFDLHLSRLPQSDDLNEGSIIMDGYYKGIHLPFGLGDQSGSDAKRFMLTGDLEEKGVAWLLANYNGHVDLFKAPHHGSYVKDYPLLLAAFTPDVVWITGGRGKRVNKLKAKSDLSDAKIEFYDTMEHGELNYVSFIERPQKK